MVRQWQRDGCHRVSWFAPRLSGMRAARLLTIQMLLETRGRLSASALARELEVSVRTLYRDIDELTSAGVPVYAERGRAGGFQLLPKWKPALTGLTPGEAEAVFLSGVAGPAAELGLGPQVEAAQLKLLAALPPDWRGKAQRASSRFHLDPVDWYREADPTPFLSDVAAAVLQEQQLSLAYESWKADVRRVVDPLGLVLKAGIWYLVAGQPQPRTYRVSSIRAARLLDGPVRRPRDFDLRQWWSASVRRFETGIYTAQATVDVVTPAARADLRRLSAAVARAVDAADPTQARLRIPIESVEHAAGQLMRLAPGVRVVAPAALRRAITARLEAALAAYTP